MSGFVQYMARLASTPPFIYFSAFHPLREDISLDFL